MRVNIKSGTAIAPCPVLIVGSYDENGRANAMTAAWGGVFNDNQVIITLAKDHLTTANILANKAFTLAYGDSKHVTECDYLGLISGSKVCKLERIGFTTTKGAYVNAPIINELAVAIECELNNVITPDSETVVIIGDVKNISVSEDVLDNNKLSLDKLRLIAFDTFGSSYRLVGEEVAKAFNVGKKYL